MHRFILLLCALMMASCNVPCQDADARTGEGLYNAKCRNCHLQPPPHLEIYNNVRHHQEKLTDCQLQAIEAYAAAAKDSLK